MEIPFNDLKSQYKALQPQIQERINRVLEHGQYIMGPEVKELEEKLQDYTGAKYCITVASGTEALLISLMALGIQPGDEIITTPFTFVSTAEVIVLLGATPVFVDIDPDTYNIDATKIKEKITCKTKALMPVSLYGQVADMDEINAIAAEYKLPVIEDAAQSFGSTYKGIKSCNLTTIGCTSFFPSKPLGCYGDGGAIFTSDISVAKACQEIRVHGQSKRYFHTRIGVGGRMDTFQAAILLEKLSLIDYEVGRRREVANRYNSNCNFGDVKIPFVSKNCESVYAQYTLQLKNRSEVSESLNQVGIPTAIHYPVPLHKQPAYANFIKLGDELPQAEFAANHVISLPMSPYLTIEHQDFIVSSLKVALDKGIK